MLSGICFNLDQSKILSFGKELIYFPACESPMVPTNGYISLSTDRLGVTFACDVGHSLSGSATSHCDVHGAGWNNTVPSCGKKNVFIASYL